MQDCYFFIDMDKDVSDAERTISILCCECREEHYPNIGWFWEGTKLGYGPWNYKCCKCGVNVAEETYEEAETDHQAE